MQTLQVIIREKLKKKGITVSEVERRAVLNKTMVQNILSINCSLEMVINCAREIYVYALRANLKDNIDEQFAEWITERHFLESNS